MRKFLFALALLPFFAVETAWAQLVFPQLPNVTLTRLNSDFADGVLSFAWGAPVDAAGDPLPFSTDTTTGHWHGYILQVRAKGGDWPGFADIGFPPGVTSSAPRRGSAFDNWILPTATHTVLRGMRAATTYEARVAAYPNFDSYDLLGWVTKTEIVIPSAPQNLQATLSGATLTFSWDALTGATAYRYRIATDGQNWITPGGARGELVTGATGASTVAAAGRDYHISIAAVTTDSAGIGIWSPPVSNAGHVLSADATLTDLQLTDAAGVAYNAPFATAFDTDSSVVSVSNRTADTATFRVRAVPNHAAAKASVRVENSDAEVVLEAKLNDDNLSPLLTQPADVRYRISVTVTAEDGGSLRVYTHRRNRSPSSAAVLDRIAIGREEAGDSPIAGTEWRPPFVPEDPAFTDYEISIPHAESFVYVAAHSPHGDIFNFQSNPPAGQEIRARPFTLDGNYLQHLGLFESVTTGTPKINLTAGTPRLLQISILAPDNVTALTYALTITRKLSSGSGDTTLSNLTLQGGGESIALNQTFAAATRTYAAATTAAQVTLTPTRNQQNASIFVEGVSVTSGSASAAISLEKNQTRRITVRVQAQNGARNEYFIEVTRNAAPEAPRGVTADAAKSGARLKWTQARAALSYRVRWRLRDSGGGTPGAWQDANGDDAECADNDAANDNLCGVAASAPTSHHLTGLTDGMQYDIAVGAANAQGVGWSGDTALQVTPAAANDARLLRLGVTSTPAGAELSPPFSPDTGEYEIRFAHSGLTALAYAHTAAAGASVVVAGTDATDNAQAVRKVGDTAVVFTVTAEDSATTKTYTVRQKLYPPFTALALTDAADSAVQLSPQFAAQNFAYEGGVLGAVENETSAVKVTATFSGVTTATAGLRAQTSAHATLASGTAATLTLNEGRNDIELSFHDAGAAPLVYAVTIYRELENATTPAAPNNVAAEIGDSALNISWDAPGNDGGATVTGYKIRHKRADAQSFSTPVDTDSTSAHALSALTNRALYDVEVAAVNLVGAGDYAKMQARPAAAADAALQSLRVSTGSFAPAFAVDTLTYTASTPYTTVRANISAAPMHARATLAGIGAKELAPGANRFAVTVTAADTVTTRAYTAVITRAPPGISAFTLHGALLEPGFDAGVFSYAATTADGTAQLTFAMTLPAGAAAELRTPDSGVTTGTRLASIAAGATETTLEFARGTREILLRYTEGGVSVEYAFTVTRGLSPPSAPLELVAGVADTQLKTRWLAPADGGGVEAGALSYELRWRADSAADFAEADAHTFAPGETLAHDITGLTNGSRYIVQARAQNAEQNGAWAEAFGMPGSFHIRESMADADAATLWVEAVLIARVFAGYDITADEEFLGATGAAHRSIWGFRGIGNVDKIDIGTKISANKSKLDVDGKNDGANLNDAILIARYLMGVRGESLTAGQTGTAVDTVLKNIRVLLP